MSSMLYQPAERRLIKNFNWGLLAITLTIGAIGVWNLASASRAAHANVWAPQAVWIGVGLVVALLLSTFDYRHLLHAAYPFYGAVVGLLVATLMFGQVSKGAQRWLDFGIRFQPSELAKLAVVLALARYYHEDKEDKQGQTLLRLWRPALLVVIPVALVIKQPDLGTAMLILAIGGTLILFARVEKRTLIGLAGAGLALAGTSWMWLLKDYQKQRILTFLNPEGDALGAGYHANQSMIAIGSGGLWGKGWGEGTQTQLSFLPEQHTDFIFSVWAEEHGFWGSVLLIGLYAVLLGMAVNVASQAKDRFGVFLSVGAAAIVFWHVFVNIGMVTGVLPVVGVTLPLMSYGGSNVVTTLLAVGLLLNVSMRRTMF